MHKAVEDAIYAAFCEQFAKSYKQPNDTLRERVWAATRKAGFSRSRSDRLLLRALEIATAERREA